MPRHTPEEKRRRRRGLLGVGDAISGARERVGEAVRGIPAGLLGGARALDKAMRDIGDSPVESFRAFSPLGGVEGAAEAPKLFRSGRPGQGLMALAGALPGIPRVRGLFRGLEGTEGLRVFARSEGPGVRKVVSITPNPKPGGGVKATIFNETVEQGQALENVVEFKNMDEAVEAIEGGRGFFRGFKKVNVGDEAFMEGQFDRFTERAASRAARASGQDMRRLAERRKAPGGVGGFFNLP